MNFSCWLLGFTIWFRMFLSIWSVQSSPVQNYNLQQVSVHQSCVNIGNICYRGIICLHTIRQSHRPKVLSSLINPIWMIIIVSVPAPSPIWVAIRPSSPHRPPHWASLETPGEEVRQVWSQQWGGRDQILSLYWLLWNNFLRKCLLLTSQLLRLRYFVKTVPS